MPQNANPLRFTKVSVAVGGHMPRWSPKSNPIVREQRRARAKNKALANGTRVTLDNIRADNGQASSTAVIL
jgi:hypothetical protein